MKLYLTHNEEEYEVHIELWETADLDNGFDDLTGCVINEDNEDMPDDFFQEILEANIDFVENKVSEAKQEYDEQNRTEAMLSYVKEY